MASRQPSAPASCLALALVCMTAWSIGLRPAAATMTMQLELPQIVAAADRAFAGRVVATHAGRDAAGTPATWVTFAVATPLKGRLRGEITIKQIGVSAPLSDGSAFHLPGVPTYAVGDELVVFLAGDSAAGFTSPIGLAQGKFPITRRGGRSYVTATPENAGALGHLRALQPSIGDAAAGVTLDDFLATVSRLVAEGKR